MYEYAHVCGGNGRNKYETYKSKPLLSKSDSFKATSEYK